MSKYSIEFKLEIVKYYEETNSGYKTTAEHFNVGYACIQRWVNKYKEHGAKGLAKNQKGYDGNFKQYVVEYMHNNHLSLQETSVHFNLAGTHVVGKWERIYYEEGPQSLYIERCGKSKNMGSKPRKKKLSKEVEEDLIDEVQRLRMENAYLKKLQALVQERVKREKPKKHKPSQN